MAAFNNIFAVSSQNGSLLPAWAPFFAPCTIVAASVSTLWWSTKWASGLYLSLYSGLTKLKALTSYPFSFKKPDVSLYSSPLGSVIT